MPVNAHVVDDGLRAAQMGVTALNADASAAKVTALRAEVEQFGQMMMLAKAIAQVRGRLDRIEQVLGIEPEPTPEPAPEEG